ncbi:MAG: FAD-dependent oxidoreductase [Patescibacteria group bacterium]|nr:FAD-dependent oxidoreductase [Patescibacteria group bacterium]
MEDKKKVVILGAGFGGLRVARLIAKKLRRLGLINRYEIVLIDRNGYQTYTPLLYEVATTSKQTANACKLLSVATYPLSHLVSSLPVTLLTKEIKGIDLIEGDIHFADSTTLVFDHLIIALGSEINYFNIPGLAEHSIPLKTFHDAVRIRDTVWSLAMEGVKDINIVVGGAGPTGVEIAAEFKEWCGELEQEFKKCRLHVTLIEGNQTVLPGFDTRVIAHATKRLKKLNIEIFTGERIEEVSMRAATLKSGRRVPFDVCVWSGGVKVPSLLADMPLEKESRGRPLAQGIMECLPQSPDLKLRSRIFGLGDCICFNDPETGKPIPSVARAALTQAGIVAHNIVEDIKSAESSTYHPRHIIYDPHSHPYVIPIGGKYAIAQLGVIYFKGLSGWILKGLVELNYLFSIMPPHRALRIWLKGLWIFIQNDRLG